MLRKRWLGMCAVTLVLVLIATFFAGCQGNNAVNNTWKPADKTDNANSETKETQPEDIYSAYRPKKYKVYVIRKANWLPGPVDNENGEMIKYYEEKLNARVIAENYDASRYNELLSLKIASGETPDIFQVRSFADFRTFFDNQVLLGFSEDLFKQLAPHIYDIFMNESPNAFDYTRLDGTNLYGVAGIRFHNQFAYPVVWRKDWLENVGISKIPDTLEELEEALYRFVRNDPDKNGKNDTYGLSTWGMNAIFAAFGYSPEPLGPGMNWTIRDGKIVYSGVQPEMKEALKLLNKWYADGIIDPEFITGENKGGDGRLSHSFINNKVGFTSGQEYFVWSPVEPIGINVTEFYKANPDAPEDAIAVTLPPVGMNGRRLNHQWPVITTSIYAFSKDLEKEPDKFGKILEVFDYTLSSYENYLTSWYGIKGKHWDVVDGVPTPVGAYTDLGERTKIGAYTHMGFIEPAVYWGEMYKERTDWAHDLGLSTQVQGLRNELLTALPSASKYEAELVKMCQEAYISIITNDKPVDYFDEFVDNWKNAGGNKLTEEANIWYSSIK